MFTWSVYIAISGAYTTCYLGVCFCNLLSINIVNVVYSSHQK